MKPTLLVLAAGMGSRYGGLKQLDQVGPSGETIIDYSIYDAIRAGFGKVVFVIRKDFEYEFRKAFVDKLEGKIEVEIVFQELSNLPEGIQLPEGREKPWGTGHAVLVAAEKIDEPFAVINADDFYGPNAYKVMAEFLKELDQAEETQYSLLGYELEKTISEHGTVSRGVCDVDENNMLKGIVETKNIGLKGEEIGFTNENDEWKTLERGTKVSMNFWGFNPCFFGYLNSNFETFIKENIEDLKSEFYIPSVVDTLRSTGLVRTTVLNPKESWFGVTYKEDKPVVMEKLQKLVQEDVYPENLWA